METKEQDKYLGKYIDMLNHINESRTNAKAKEAGYLYEMKIFKQTSEAYKERINELMSIGK